MCDLGGATSGLRTTTVCLRVGGRKFGTFRHEPKQNKMQENFSPK